MQDKLLIEQLSDGDTKALKEIYRNYAAYVATVIRNISRGTLRAEDIDEITADVFYKLWKSRSALNPELGLCPYLSAIARNTVKDRFKHTAPICGDISELNISLDFNLEEIAELNEMMNCLKEGLRRLPKDEQEIFFRFYFYGERSSEIAEKMCVSENNVYKKLHRTRNKLKDFLIERGFDYV